MPSQRQIDVLSDLKSLSDEGDQLAQDCFKGSNIEEWLDVCRQVIIKIRDCSSVEDLQAIHYPDTIYSFLGIKGKKENSQADELMGAQSEKVHVKNQVAVPSEVAGDEKLMSAFVSLTPCDKLSVLKGNDTATKVENKFTGDQKLMSVFVSLTPCDKLSVLKGNNTSTKVENKFMSPLIHTKSDKNLSDKTTSLRLPCIKNNPSVLSQQIKTPNLDGSYIINYSDGGISESQFLTKTPVLRRTFNKIADERDTVDSSQKTKLLKAGNANGVLTRSGSKKKTVATSENEADNAKPAQSGSKRKSSDSKNESNKKQKMNALETPTFAANKIIKAKHLLLKTKSSKSSLVSTPKRASKMSAVIVPPAQPKNSRVSKEQQILEEIKKKEEKAKSNIKRVLAERQEKAEMSKKNQEEKRQKALEKRMQIQKEKEERLRQESENLAKKAKTREVTENHGKEKKSSVKDNKSLASNPMKQKHSYVDTGCKTPKAEKSDDIESYELTPLPNSSTYNFSDDEDEKPSGKPIPFWAQGVHLKSALIQQFYNSIDPRTIFGSHLDSPDLVQIFKMNKKTYKKRTSSAIWNKLESSFRY